MKGKQRITHLANNDPQFSPDTVENANKQIGSRSLFPEYAARIDLSSQIADVRAQLRLLLAQNTSASEQFSGMRSEVQGLKAELAKTEERLRLLLSKKKSPKAMMLTVIAAVRTYYVSFLAKRTVRQSQFFDAAWYLSEYPDVANLRIDPIHHYLQYGAAEERDPSKLFSTKDYLRAYPDVTQTGINPLVHYLRYGRREGRNPRPSPLGQLESRAMSSAKLAEIISDLCGEACSKRVPDYFEIIRKLKQATTPAARHNIIRALTDKLSIASKLADRGDAVDVSIVIPVYNNVEYTIACVQSILDSTTKYDYEVIVGDDQSTDETQDVFKSIGGAVRIVTHDKNGGFVRNCNLTARCARGAYIVLLNNDTIVLDGWLDALRDQFEADKSIGLVGSKLLMPSGLLQEAGGICWRDGTAWNFGRGQDPRLPEFNYVKEVDYISGASIAIPARLWKDLGGFDKRYIPAYCEDSDLAFSVRSRGYRTVYNPFSVVVHHEGASHGFDPSSGVKAHQVENSRKLAQKWRAEFEKEHFANSENVFVARDRSVGKPHILIVDHYLPEVDVDAGSKTIFEYVKLFASRGFQVTFWPDNLAYNKRYASALQCMGVEVIYGEEYLSKFEEWIKTNGHHIEYAFLSRAHIAVKYIDPIRRHSTAKVLFYGHDIHHLRLEQQLSVTNEKAVENEIVFWRDIECDAWERADVVYYPAKFECNLVRRYFPKKIVRQIPAYFYSDEMLNLASLESVARIRAVPRLLFVGGFRHSPNVDGILWFCREVLPKIREKGKRFVLYIVGSHPPAEVRSLSAPDVVVTGFVPDSVLESIYLSSDLSIAPLRFGGGVKGKVIEALRYGLPVLTTSIGIQGLDGAEKFITVEDTAEGFAIGITRLLDEPERRLQLAKSGFRYVVENYSVASAIEKIGFDCPELARHEDGVHSAARWCSQAE